MSAAPLCFTVFQSIKPAVLTKRYSLVDGTLTKSSSADMTEGTAQLTTCSDLTEFDGLLTSMPGSQALSYGVCLAHPSATIRAAQALGPGDIARTKEYFQFANSPGIMMLDHDGTVDGKPIDADTLRGRLIEAVPELADASMLWRVSASSCLSNEISGAELTPVKGQRLYVAVQDASLIPAAGKALVLRLWAAGMGWIEVGKAGQALKRTFVDDCVWQPNRLDFAGAPELGAGITRNVPKSAFFGPSGVLFDLRRITCDNGAERLAAAAQTKARSDVAAELEEARTAYVNDTAPKLAASRSISLGKAQALLKQATGSHVLASQFELYPQHADVVTVEMLLAEPEKWHKVNFADPLEPDYGGGNRTMARAYLTGPGSPFIRSFAHGGMKYLLRPPARRIKVVAGDRARINDETLEALRTQGEIYDFGEGTAMARISRHTAVPVTRDWLVDHIDRNCEFYKVKLQPGGESTEIPQDCPPSVAPAIMAKHGERGFRRLEAVITAPTLRRDGSILDEPGFDNASGLLYLSSGKGLRVPRAPTREQAVEALIQLWEPVRDFPFVAAEDRGVMLAAMLTAVLRASLPTAPGFAFDAPAAGSGKTLLAKVVGILAIGAEPSISAPAGQEEEMRKRLFASLREGARVVLWDNLQEPLRGASIDSFLTAPSFSDRILGVSETATLPNRALFLCTGNNLRLAGDTCRRVLLARIDPKSETPYARDFKVDPAAEVLLKREELVVAALTIVRAYITAGSPRMGRGRTASFEQWDDFVRQPLLWLSDVAATSSSAPTLADPLNVVERQFSEDPETQKLGALMDAWYKTFGDKPVPVAKAIKTASCITHSDLHDALQEIGGLSGTINSRMVGRWMERNRCKRHHKKRVERGTVICGRQTWRVLEDAEIAT
jgi:hypothetical protein